MRCKEEGDDEVQPQMMFEEVGIASMCKNEGVEECTENGTVSVFPEGKAAKAHRKKKEMKSLRWQAQYDQRSHE